MSEAAEFYCIFHKLFLTLTQRTHLWNSHQIVYLDTLGLLLNGYVYRQCTSPALPALTSLKNLNEAFILERATKYTFSMFLKVWKRKFPKVKTKAKVSAPPSPLKSVRQCNIPFCSLNFHLQGTFFTAS